MNFLLKLFSILSFFSLVHSQNPNGAYGLPEINPKMLSAPLLFNSTLQAVTNLLNDERVSDIDRLRLVMLYALRYEKESPVQLMQLFNKLASRSAKYKPGVKITKTCFLSVLGGVLVDAPLLFLLEACLGVYFLCALLALLFIIFLCFCHQKKKGPNQHWQIGVSGRDVLGWFLFSPVVQGVLFFLFVVFWGLFVFYLLALGGVQVCLLQFLQSLFWQHSFQLSYLSKKRSHFHCHQADTLAQLFCILPWPAHASATLRLCV